MESPGNRQGGNSWIDCLRSAWVETRAEIGARHLARRHSRATW